MAGQVEAVRYHQVIPLLLHALQEQQQQLGAQSRQLRRQSQELAEVKAENTSLRAAMGHRLGNTPSPAVT
jgi:cell shape-determining protein MreC